MPDTLDMDAVMQAVESAKRILADTAYGGETGDILYDQDATAVAEALLSILPKGKRPVAVPDGEDWKISVGGLGEFRDNDEANLAIHWDLLDQIREHVANPPPAPSEE